MGGLSTVAAGGLMLGAAGVASTAPALAEPLTCYLPPYLLPAMITAPPLPSPRLPASGAWLPGGNLPAPRAPADAARLVALWQRIDPTATLRAIPAA
jgi:hypothetical protein